MDTGELLVLLRQELADTVEPYLWSDDELLTYLNDAQVMLARKTDGIPDASTPAVTQLAITPGVEWYPLHAKVLKVRTATRLSDGGRLEVLTPETAERNGVRFNGTQGPVRVAVQGFEDRKLRVWPIPSVADTLELAVFRMPLKSLLDADPEVAEQHHIHLLLWARSRAYLKQDAETFDKGRADDFETRFRAYCEEVIREQSRIRRSSGTVTYGGL